MSYKLQRFTRKFFATICISCGAPCENQRVYWAEGSEGAVDIVEHVDHLVVMMEMMMVMMVVMMVVVMAVLVALCCVTSAVEC